MDFEFETENAVLYPRPETEILVEKAIDLLSGHVESGRTPAILDIGTGCGNIAISLTKYILSGKIVALDISDAALRVAEGNAATHGVRERIVFLKSNLFENVKKNYENYFDLIISNPPYVSLEDFSSLPEEVKSDPYIALYGGTDGTDFYRRITKESPAFLKSGGILLMEIGYNQADAVKALLENSGNFRDICVYKDYANIDRIIKARKNG